MIDRAATPRSAALDGDDLLEQFETAWRHGPPPALPDYLPPAGPLRRAALEELIKIDLEYRWRGRPAGQPGPLVDDYVRQLPELADGLPLHLIGEEYWVRQRWGDQPALAEYLARFPEDAEGLRDVLGQIQAELDEEFGGRAPLASPVRVAPASAATATPVTSVAALVAEITQRSLLLPEEAGQLDDLRGQHPELRPLVKELLARQWLTAYQANRLLQGRGDELTIGPYVLLDRLGDGATGWVFKARHQTLQRLVALKVLRQELLTDADALGRFYREVQVVSQLTHPNVIHAYDAGPLDGKHVLVMEHVEGTDLRRVVKESGPLRVPAAREVIIQAALGLQYIHERGLVHRDVKPSNLLLARTAGGDSVKVLDLGLARLGRLARRGQAPRSLGGSSGRLTPRHALGVGTPDFMAPEQALDFHRADIRADIYSLGCTFHFLLTGQPPFPGGTLAGKLLRHQDEEPPHLDGHVPAPVNAVIRRMLAKTPEQRFATPAEVCAALGHEAPVRIEQPVAPAVAAPPPVADFPVEVTAPAPRRQVRVPRWASVATPLLVLLAVSLSVRWLMLGNARTPPASLKGRGRTETHAGTHPPLLDFGSGFGSASGLKCNGAAQLDDGQLRLTSDGNQAGSVFTTLRLPVSRFHTEFTFTLQGKPDDMADGMTFTIQGVGPDALGSTGGGLGYGLDPSSASTARIRRSAAIKFDTYDNVGEGTSSTGLYLDGNPPGTGDAWTDLHPAGINLRGGHPFRATLHYDGTTLMVTVADTVSRATHVQQYRINFPALVGGPTAHVGFTGGTGGSSAVQRVSRWVFDGGDFTSARAEK